MKRTADCIIRALEVEAVAQGVGLSDAYIVGRLSALVECLFDRGETTRCAAVGMARSLEVAGRARLEVEARL